MPAAAREDASIYRRSRRGRRGCLCVTRLLPVPVPVSVPVAVLVPVWVSAAACVGANVTTTRGDMPTQPLRAPAAATKTHRTRTPSPEVIVKDAGAKRSSHNHMSSGSGGSSAIMAQTMTSRDVNAALRMDALFWLFLGLLTPALALWWSGFAEALVTGAPLPWLEFACAVRPLILLPTWERCPPVA